MTELFGRYSRNNPRYLRISRKRRWPSRYAKILARKLGDALLAVIEGIAIVLLCSLLGI